MWMAGKSIVGIYHLSCQRKVFTGVTMAHAGIHVCKNAHRICYVSNIQCIEQCVVIKSEFDEALQLSKKSQNE